MLRFLRHIVKRRGMLKGCRGVDWVRAFKTPRVGIVGAGQLARMTAQAAIALGIDLRILANVFEESAARVWPDVVLGSPDDPVAIENLAAGCFVTTFDHELVDTEAIMSLERDGHRFAPSGETMSIAQSKRLQREHFAALGLPVPSFAVARPGGIQSSLKAFADRHGWPVAIKADRGGYDGRGVWIAESEAEGLRICEMLDRQATTAVFEQWVPIDREVAIQIARTPSGRTATYPLVETVQIEGMLRELLAPAAVDPQLEAGARTIAERIAADIDVVGMLAVELFVSNGELLVNEIATRPHNSGHHTIEGCVTSQFEQHLRAVLDLPLGSTALTGQHVVTVNAVGNSWGMLLEEHLAAALEVEGAHVHIYGKKPRANRKLGHVTVVADDRYDALERARQAARRLEGDPNDD